MSTYFTSDPHFGHRRIPELADRPFASLEEMTETFLARWNSRVTAPDDVVWILGDFALGDIDASLSLLPRLNGRKMLIEGNHDRCWVGHPDGWKHQRAYLDAGFEVVSPWARIKLPPTPAQQMEGQPGRPVLLSHFPYALDHTPNPRYAQFRLRDEGAWLLHGHVHGAYTVRQRGVNVGVDRWDYTPVPATTIARLIEDVENGVRGEG